MLELESGILTFLIGPNAAGKTTALKKLAHSLNSPKKVAVLSQDPQTAFDMQVIDLVLLGRYPYKTCHEVNLKRANLALQQLEIEHLAERHVLGLSGGEKRLVHLARVLAQLEFGGYLLLDEPTANLDLKYQHKICQIAESVAKRGHRVLLVCHDLNLAYQYAEKLILLRDGGSIVAMGLADEVLQAGVLREVYGVEVF